MSVMAETHQSAMGPYVAMAAVRLALNAWTAVFREAMLVKVFWVVQATSGGLGEGGGDEGEGGVGDGGGGLGDGRLGDGGGGLGKGEGESGGGGLGDGGGGQGEGGDEDDGGGEGGEAGGQN
eukprot:scaffold97976_cov62-Phaeocystis_antarctica.AAC.4